MLRYRRARSAVVALMSIGMAATALTAAAQPSMAQAPAIAAVPAIGTVCGGMAYGPPGFGTNYGPVGQSNCVHGGFAGRMQSYTWYVPFYSRGTACVQARGWVAVRGLQWYPAGCGRSGSATVPWGNSMGYPAMRADSQGFFGTPVLFND